MDMCRFSSKYIADWLRFEINGRNELRFIKQEGGFWVKTKRQPEGCLLKTVSG